MIKVIKIINPPDDSHCRNPRSKGGYGRCKHMRWVSYGAYCELYEREIIRCDSGIIPRPEFCQDNEVDK
jgi:hypothetical protein